MVLRVLEDLWDLSSDPWNVVVPGHYSSRLLLYVEGGSANILCVCVCVWENTCMFTYLHTYTYIYTHNTPLFINMYGRVGGEVDV